ncbi:uncharacterized protein LOC110447314 [Mizuhopecten yessoensis]|uniref:Uncharacterized protein n=1 Tax=Mizuhopecten yessoensis TaxID=6573 RepID=A0A210QVL2_MIZYE|nr:uncharacterized protein LOC110447314 [Mizuhopecten yessoensis]OWF52780.1 hypothetical protein KP79_PYT17567 [Mizuhopecten yessoensis]
MHCIHLRMIFVVLLLPCTHQRPVRRSKRNLSSHRWNHPCTANPLPVLHDIVRMPANIVLPVYDIRRILSSSLIALKDTIEIVNSALMTLGESMPCSLPRSTSRNYMHADMYTTIPTTHAHCDGLDELLGEVFYEGFPRCTVQNLCTTNVFQLQQCYEDLQLSVIALEMLTLGSADHRRYRFPANDIDRLIHKQYDVLCFLLDVDSVSQTFMSLTDFYTRSRGAFEALGTLSVSDFQEMAYIVLRGVRTSLTHVKSIIEFRISILQ